MPLGRDGVFSTRTRSVFPAKAWPSRGESKEGKIRSPTTNSILEFNNKESVSDVLNELLREGAQQLIRITKGFAGTKESTRKKENERFQQICDYYETELSEYLSQHQRIADDGRLALVRNGYLPKREILTGIVFAQSVSASPRYVQKMGRH